VTILLPRLYARLLTIFGQTLPGACFVYLAAFKEFFELPRLLKAVSIVLNERRVSVQRASSARSEALFVSQNHKRIDIRRATRGNKTRQGCHRQENERYHGDSR
jgi:hypothetical protein